MAAAGGATAASAAAAAANSAMAAAVSITILSRNRPSCKGADITHACLFGSQPRAAAAFRLARAKQAVLRHRQPRAHRRRRVLAVD
eukprot:CAMPEP_0115857488 /NCGR_PEP_ID=MMETSP0287-20121206/15600_1 /TAXON_ID=412157 /ORGANISM="Chrysochromulina rotalis, Strain UIO044" /LENGTH=85 /DNA_ID=CAMNT_0003311707 /DNA_START=240 /DNA_END=497 /DNA_ORIENTATION=-